MFAFRPKSLFKLGDGHLMLRAIERLAALARQQGVALRQSYARVARHARREAARLLHGRGHKQGMRWLRKLRTWLGRVIRKRSGDRLYGFA